MSDNANQPTFLFHDYETFGKSPALDRPAQFAGIRTDMDFNIIGEPEVLLPASGRLSATAGGGDDHRHYAAAGAGARSD